MLPNGCSCSTNIIVHYIYNSNKTLWHSLRRFNFIKKHHFSQNLLQKKEPYNKKYQFRTLWCSWLLHYYLNTWRFCSDTFIILHRGEFYRHDMETFLDLTRHWPTLTLTHTALTKKKCCFYFAFPLETQTSCWYLNSFKKLVFNGFNSRLLKSFGNHFVYHSSRRVHTSSQGGSTLLHNWQRWENKWVHQLKSGFDHFL